MTKFPDFFGALCAPFQNDEVKTRSQAGRQFSYVSARTIQNRFDDVCGPEGWWADFVPYEHGVMCRITVVLPDGAERTKTDVGGAAGMADEGDDAKSTFSDALKRAACMWGVGRYLWRDGVPNFARDDAHAAAPAPAHAAAHAPAHPGRDDYAREERAAMREESHAPAPRNQEARNPDARNGSRTGGPPRSGKALFAALKNAEDRTGMSLIRYINEFSKLQDWPARMVEFDAEQTALAWAEACRKVKESSGEVLEGAGAR